MSFDFSAWQRAFQLPEPGVPGLDLGMGAGSFPMPPMVMPEMPLLPPPPRLPVFSSPYTAPARVGRAWMPPDTDIDDDALMSGLNLWQKSKASNVSNVSNVSNAYPTVSGGSTSENVMRWLPMAQAAAQRHGIPVEMVLAVIHNESGGDPNAQSPYNPGQGYARGLMQVMPYHFQAGENPLDPATNIEKGTAYLASMYKRYGDPDKAMAAYFGGPGAIDENGNIRTDRSDVNISIGDYLAKKWRPVYSAYLQRVRGGTQARSGTGLWDSIVPGGRGRTERGGTHGGYPAVDIFANEGTPIYAPVDGVSTPGTYSLGGNATTIQGADGRWYYFAHAQRPMAGGQVRKGQIIGYVGRTGNARNTAPHLHYAVASNPQAFSRYNGSGDIDPEHYH